MKNSFFKRTAVLLAVLCTCVFVGCKARTDSAPYSGIVVSQENMHSQETEAYAETVIFSVLQYATYQKTGIAPNAVTVEKLKEVSKNVQAIMVSSPIHEDLYRKVLEKVERVHEDVVDEVLKYQESGGTENALSATKALYLDLSATVGVDYVGETLYDLCVYLYQYQYDETMANYEKYGYPYLKLDAERYQAEQIALKNGIGKRNFTTLLKSGFAFADLLLSEGLQSDKISAFTDTEILLFLQNLGISSLSVTEEGWQLVLSRAIPDEGGTYATKLLSLVKAHDLSEGARATRLGVELLSNTVNKLTEADAAMLKDGDFYSWIQSAFQRFDETDWALWEQMTAFSLEAEEYDALAVQTYGDAYVQYKENLAVYTLAELRAAVLQDNFYDVLKGYIAGISPAISYGMAL